MTEALNQNYQRALEVAGNGLDLLIDGEIRESLEGLTHAVFDPSTGREIGKFARAGKQDVDFAVAGAKRALEGEWGRVSAKDREKMLRRLAVLVDEHREELALLEALDAGKPIGMSRAVDIPLSIDNFDYYSGWPTKLYGATIPAGGPDMLVYTLNEPVGVVGHIIPWNFPLFDATGRIAMAIAAGCPIVLKVSEVTPLSAMYLGKLVLEAGIPAGVVNILPGYGSEAGQAIVDHPDVRAIGFTGSTAVGRSIAASASSSLKHVSLELGGKSPMVLFNDCSLERAIDAAQSAIFLNTGQVCSAGSRLLVEDGIYDKVVEELSNRASRIKVAGAFADGAEMGPVVSSKQYDTVRGFIEVGSREGSLAVGGLERPADAGEGYFIAPTIISNLETDAKVVRDEIFGPVLAVERFSGFDEALKKANSGRYGLAASVWSENGAKATRFAHGMHAGTVWVNCFHMYDIAVPWGGVKESGIGRERSGDSLAHLLDKKAIWSSLG